MMGTCDFLWKVREPMSGRSPAYYYGVRRGNENLDRVLLAEISIARERQIADPGAGGGKNRITKRGDERPYPRLADGGGGRRALRNVDVRLSGNLVDPGDGVIIEIGLLDYAVLGSD